MFPDKCWAVYLKCNVSIFYWHSECQYFCFCCRWITKRWFSFTLNQKSVAQKSIKCTPSVDVHRLLILVSLFTCVALAVTILTICYFWCYLRCKRRGRLPVGAVFATLIFSKLFQGVLSFCILNRIISIMSDIIAQPSFRLKLFVIPILKDSDEIFVSWSFHCLVLILWPLFLDSSLSPQVMGHGSQFLLASPCLSSVPWAPCSMCLF